MFAGCLLLTVATVPFMFVTGHTPTRCSLESCSSAGWGSAPRSNPPSSRPTSSSIQHRCRGPPPRSTRCDRSAGRSAPPFWPSSPTRGHSGSLVAPLRSGRAAEPTPKRRTRPDQRTGRERVRSGVSLGAADCAPDTCARRRADPHRTHPRRQQTTTRPEPPRASHGPPGPRRLTPRPSAPNSSATEAETCRDTGTPNLAPPQAAAPAPHARRAGRATPPPAPR